jgi:amidase
VDPFDVPNYEELTKNIWCNSFHYDVNQYLASLGAEAKYKTLAAIVESGQYSPYIERRLKEAVQTTPTGPPCQDLFHDPRNIAFREALLAAMDKLQLDAVIYPTWSNPPRKVGDLQSPAGDNSQILSPQTGFPAITVPMGFTAEALPTGMTFLGRAFSEPALIKYVYAYERATTHRKPPEKFPVLKGVGK